MKRVLLAIFLVFGFTLLLITELYAQTAKIEWSPILKTNNKENGVYRDIIGENQAYTYYLYSDFRDQSFQNNIHILGISHDNPEKMVRTVVKIPKEWVYKDMQLQGIYVTNNYVYVFWEKRAKNRLEIYVKLLDINLEVAAELVKLHQFLYPSEGDYSRPHLFVRINSTNNATIVIGAETSVLNGSQIEVECRSYSHDLRLQAVNQIKLPYSANTDFTALSASYELGNDGNLHILARLREPTTDGSLFYYNAYTFLNLQNGRYDHIKFLFEDKKVLGLKIRTTPNEVLFYGFYHDYRLGEFALIDQVHGSFTAKLNKSSVSLTNVDFKRFDRPISTSIPQKANRNVTGTNSENSTTQVYGDFQVEQLHILENGDLFFVASAVQNNTFTICYPGGTCRTSFYHLKGNISILILSPGGSLKWKKEIPRWIEYANWNTPDLSLIRSKDDFLLIYGDVAKTAYTSNNAENKMVIDQSSIQATYINLEKELLTPTPIQLNFLFTAEKSVRQFNASSFRQLGNRVYLAESESKTSNYGKFLRVSTTVLIPIGLITDFGKYHNEINTSTRFGKVALH